MNDKLTALQGRATEKLLKARRATQRITRLEKLLVISKIREGVAWREYNSARIDCEQEIKRATAQVAETEEIHKPFPKTLEREEPEKP